MNRAARVDSEHIRRIALNKNGFAIHIWFHWFAIQLCGHSIFVIVRRIYDIYFASLFLLISALTGPPPIAIGNDFSPSDVRQ